MSEREELLRLTQELAAWRAKFPTYVYAEDTYTVQMNPEYQKFGCYVEGEIVSSTMGLPKIVCMLRR